MEATINTKNILDFVYSFPDVVKNGNWVSRYDTETDEFSLTAPKLSDNARISYFSDEIAFYVTPDQKIEGLFIEYFRNNFIQHHQDLEGILSGIDPNKISDSSVEENAVIDLKQEEVDKVMPELGEIIKSSLTDRLQLSPVE